MWRRFDICSKNIVLPFITYYLADPLTYHNWSDGNYALLRTSLGYVRCLCSSFLPSISISGVGTLTPRYNFVNGFIYWKGEDSGGAYNYILYHDPDGTVNRWYLTNRPEVLGTVPICAKVTIDGTEFGPFGYHYWVGALPTSGFNTPSSTTSWTMNYCNHQISGGSDYTLTLVKTGFYWKTSNTSAVYGQYSNGSETINVGTKIYSDGSYTYYRPIIDSTISIRRRVVTENEVLFDGMKCINNASRNVNYVQGVGYVIGSVHSSTGWWVSSSLPTESSSVTFTFQRDDETTPIQNNIIISFNSYSGSNTSKIPGYYANGNIWR